jgi:hypothetical protein
MGANRLNIAIMQPTFNPWLGYFDLINYVDKFIFLDTVQLDQQSWQTRNKLKIQDQELLFSLPIMKNKSKKELLIKDALLDFTKFDFRKKLYKTLDQNNKKSKYYKEISSFIEELVYFETNFLSNYNINIIKQIVSKLKLDTNIITLSEVDFNSTYSQIGNNFIPYIGIFDILYNEGFSGAAKIIKQGSHYSKFDYASNIDSCIPLNC